MAAMLFNGLDYRIGYKEWLFLDHLQGFLELAQMNYSRLNHV